MNKKKFIIGDYVFYAYVNWAGPNFLPLAVYEGEGFSNCLWDVILEFKGDEVIAWNKFKCESARRFEYTDGVHVIGEDRTGDIWIGIKKLNPNNAFFKKVYPLIEPELQDLRAEIILGE